MVCTADPDRLSRTSNNSPEFDSPGDRPRAPPRGLEVALFADLCGLTLAVTQIVELGPANIPALHDFNLLNGGRMQEERCARHRRRSSAYGPCRSLPQPSTLACDNVALEDLDALLSAFDDSHMHLEFVTRLKVGNVVSERVGIDEVGGLHGVYLLDQVKSGPATFGSPACPIEADGDPQ